MPLFCKYARVAGLPGEGVHATRLFGMAAFDLVGTLLIAVGIAAWICWRRRPLGVGAVVAVAIAVFVTLMTLSVFSHWLFCVPTALTKSLGLVDGRDSFGSFQTSCSV